jgi:hypothetical protein
MFPIEVGTWVASIVPCPDHRIDLDAERDNVRSYCDQMHRVFRK